MSNRKNQIDHGGFAGVIFDFNGTLFWDTPMHVQAWKMISKKLRSTPFSQFDESYANQVIRDFAQFPLERFFVPINPLSK